MKDVPSAKVRGFAQRMPKRWNPERREMGSHASETELRAATMTNSGWSLPVFVVLGLDGEALILSAAITL